MTSVFRKKFKLFRALRYAPFGHFLQKLEPSLSAKVPSGQRLQVPEPSPEYVPTGHFMHSNEPAVEYVPGGQSSHPVCFLFGFFPELHS